jgi:hypothetical protein
MRTKNVRDVLWAAAGAVLLMTAVGCPSAAEKSDAAKSQSSGSKQSPDGELATAAKPPAAEFQQPVPALPSEPLPKPTPEPAAHTAAQLVEPSPPVASETVPPAGDAPPAKAK